MTERHRYGWFLDGYYPEYTFIRYTDGWDGDAVKVMRFGGYAPVINEWTTFSLEKKGNTFYMYENGELKNTYTETDSAPDELIAVSVHGCWISTVQYDYMSVSTEGSLLRAWIDENSLGLENDRLFLHGSEAAGNYQWFFDYLIFKDTNTTWYQPWNELAIIVYPLGSLGPWTAGADYEITATTEMDKAYLTYNVTKDNLRQIVNYTIYPSEPYIYISFSTTNVGSIVENTWAGFQFTTWIAGDYANDHYYVPGYGERQFTGGTNDIYYTNATETWVATWDLNKEEGAGILSTKGFIPSNIMSIDWGIGEGFRFSSDNFDLEPGESVDYDCYLYFFTGTNWQVIKDFYDYTSPPHELAIQSLPTGIGFTVDDVPHSSPWLGLYNESTTVSIEMPATHYYYVWSHWLEDGDTNRTKIVVLDSNVSLTGRFYHVADLNHDNMVDMRDVGIAARAFGSYPGHDRWNPIADITGPQHLVPDDSVDMRDIGLITRNFGLTYL
jgi:hypothetical protein